MVLSCHCTGQRLASCHGAAANFGRHQDLARTASAVRNSQKRHEPERKQDTTSVTSAFIASLAPKSSIPTHGPIHLLIVPQNLDSGPFDHPPISIFPPVVGVRASRVLARATRSQRPSHLQCARLYDLIPSEMWSLVYANENLLVAWG